MTDPQNNATITLDRRTISALARRICAETGLEHARTIATIARGLGFADGNALMGSLKATEKATEKTGEYSPVAPEHAPGGDAIRTIATPRGGVVVRDVPSAFPDIEAAPDAPCAGYLYELHFPFISDEDYGSGYGPGLTLSDILYEVDQGGAVGGFSPSECRLMRTPITRDDLDRLALAFGSTPAFFGDPDET